MSCVLRDEVGQIQLVDYLNNEPRQVIFVQPVVQRGRQQISSLAVGYDEMEHAIYSRIQ